MQQQIELMETSNLPLPDDLTYSESTLGTSRPARLEEHKVLGIPWSAEADSLHFDDAHLARHTDDLMPTKINIVSLVGRFYDPLGFLSPVIIKFKILFQKLCQSKSNWDQVIPDGLLKEWNKLSADLKQALPISLLLFRAQSPCDLCYTLWVL